MKTDFTIGSTYPLIEDGSVPFWESRVPPVPYGLSDANDAQFANVRVWRDLNQDGVSDAGELQSLSDAGIASINLDATQTVTNFGNGNVQTASSTFTRTDGTTSKIANLDLADNPFYRTYADSVVLTEQAKALPGMQGSGAVRDLREAASLSADVATALTGYAAQTTRAGQQAQLDGLKLDELTVQQTAVTRMKIISKRAVVLPLVA